MDRWGGWKAFAAWTLAGALGVFSVLSGFSIGLLVLPVALIAGVFVARRASAWPESVGVVAGAGAVCLLVAFLARDYEPCPENHVLVLQPRQTAVECGGFDPLPWFVTGIALVAASSLAHVAFRRTR